MRCEYEQTLVEAGKGGRGMGEDGPRAWLCAVASSDVGKPGSGLSRPPTWSCRERVGFFARSGTLRRASGDQALQGLPSS